MAEFNPSILPAPGSNQSWTPKVLYARFGNGYSQRAEDGLNSNLGLSTWAWPLLDRDQAQELKDWFALYTAESFDWIPPRETVSRKFIVKQWSESYPGGDNYALQAQFEEVVDL